jgi:hypothetical protein
MNPGTVAQSNAVSSAVSSAIPNATSTATPNATFLDKWHELQGWIEVLDDGGRSYYYQRNVETSSTYNVPVGEYVAYIAKDKRVHYKYTRKANPVEWEGDTTDMPPTTKAPAAPAKAEGGGRGGRGAKSRRIVRRSVVRRGEGTRKR